MKDIFIILNNQTLYENHLSYTPRIFIQGLSSISDFTTIEQKDIYIADGGINFIKEDLLVSNKVYWVGDSDSTINLDLLHKLSSDNITYLDTDKDYSDFGKILDILYSHQQSYFIQIQNGLHGDSSHELSNIYEASYYIDNMMKNYKIASTIYFYPSIVITNDTVKLDIPEGSRFSIIPSFSYPSGVSIQGASYEGKFRLARPSMGTRNSSHENLCISSLDHSTIMIVLD